MEIFAWLVLRIAFAGLFLCALKSLSKDRAGAENLVRLLLPTAQPILISFLTVMMFLCMFFGSLSILLGIYAQLAGLSLLVYCLIGVVVHYRLAGQAKKYVYLSRLHLMIKDNWNKLFSWLSLAMQLLHKRILF